MKFGYHNHDFKFSQKLDDTRVYDIILDNTDPLVIHQLDIDNMVNGGAKAGEVMKKYLGRFPLMHVKVRSFLKFLRPHFRSGSGL